MGPGRVNGISSIKSTRAKRREQIKDKGSQDYLQCPHFPGTGISVKSQYSTCTFNLWDFSSVFAEQLAWGKEKGEEIEKEQKRR